MRQLTIHAATSADADDLKTLSPALRAADANEQEWLLLAREGELAVGCVRIRRSIGRDVPRYWYHVGCVVHAAPELRLFHEQRTLLLNNDHTGAVEIADLACDPSLGREAQLELMRVLVRAAGLLIARERAAGDPALNGATLIAEVAGVRDHAGRSPFWESLGRHFYESDPERAAERFGALWRSYVAALLPRDPLVVSFLSERAQSALGQAGAPAHTQLEALLAEGFRRGRYVTIDEAGPVLESELEAFVSAARAERCVVRALRGVERCELWLAAPVSGVRVDVVEGVRDDATLLLDAHAMRRLSVAEGDAVWVAPHPSAAHA